MKYTNMKGPFGLGYQCLKEELEASNRAMLKVDRLRKVDRPVFSISEASALIESVESDLERRKADAEESNFWIDLLMRLKHRFTPKRTYNPDTYLAAGVPRPSYVLAAMRRSMR